MPHAVTPFPKQFPEKLASCRGRIGDAITAGELRGRTSALSRHLP